MRMRCRTSYSTITYFSTTYWKLLMLCGIISYYVILNRRKILAVVGLPASLSTIQIPLGFFLIRVSGATNPPLVQRRVFLWHRANLLAQRTVTTTNAASRAMIDGQTELNTVPTRWPSVIEFDWFSARNTNANPVVGYYWNDRLLRCVLFEVYFRLSLKILSSCVSHSAEFWHITITHEKK